MNPPRFHALRLWTRAPWARPPRPPCGLRAWDAGAAATAVLLDATGVDLTQSPAVAQQIPSASVLPAETPVLVLGVAVRGGSFWRRWLGSRRVLVDRATRCSALIARGYVDVGAGVDPSTGADLAWGWVPQATGQPNVN